MNNDSKSETGRVPSCAAWWFAGWMVGFGMGLGVAGVVLA